MSKVPGDTQLTAMSTRTGSPENAASVAYPFRANILLVDDRPANLLALEAILAPLKQRLVRALSGAEALERLSKEDYAVILMDLRMPEMDGLRTTELIKQSERCARVPIIFLTAVSLDPLDVISGYERGAVDFLLKPFEPTILRSKVSVFVDLFLKEQTIRRQAAQLHQREREALERRSEMRFRSLIDAMPQCVWAARLDKMFHYWNKQAADYTGIPVGLSVPVSALLEKTHPDDRARGENLWSDLVHNERPFEGKLRLRRASDGAYRWHLARGLPQPDESGAIVGWLIAATDIDSEEEALAKAEAASRMKDEFLATVSHELRNPLNAINGWTRLLRSGTLDAAKTAKALEVIERNAGFQAGLIDDILDVSRIVQGRIKISFRPLRFVPIIESALAAIRPTADAKGVKLESELDGFSDFVRGDADRLQQTVWNLLSNAVKFTPREGKVTVRLGRESGALRLAVSDTGQGISPAFLPFVFERFRQADSSTTRVHGGLGLGLAIVRHFVELHGGSVKAESAGEGLGATFVITLPLDDLPGSAAGGDTSQSARTAQLPLRDVSVLLVEDEDDSREMLAELLSQQGAKVTTAASSADALAKIASEVPQVLLSDIGMPGDDGYALIRKVRERLPNTTMVTAAVTGLGSAADRHRVLDAGFHLCGILGNSRALLEGRAGSLERPGQCDRWHGAHLIGCVAIEGEIKGVGKILTVSRGVGDLVRAEGVFDGEKGEVSIGPRQPGGNIDVIGLHPAQHRGWQAALRLAAGCQGGGARIAQQVLVEVVVEGGAGDDAADIDGVPVIDADGTAALGLGRCVIRRRGMLIVVGCMAGVGIRMR